MTDITARFAEIVGDHNLLAGDAIPEDYWHDEVLTTAPQQPAYVAKPATAEEVSQLLKVASEDGVPVTARGSGSGLSGAAIPRKDGLLISFERMNAGPGGRHHQPGRRRPARGDPDRAGRRDRRRRAELHGAAGRAVLQRRRQRRDQRRRDARGQVRDRPPQRARAAGGAADRRDHPHRRQDRQGVHRLRPDPAHRRLRGHPGPGHRGDRQAASAARPRRHRAGAVRRLRSGDGGGAQGSGQWARALHPRVHRQHDDGRHSSTPRTSSWAFPTTFATAPGVSRCGP